MRYYGSLYVVATPIGNLEDVTLRALRVLKEVDFILSEDTRTTLKLLNKYQIKKKLIPFHKFNENEILAKILSLLMTDKNLALVSDSGTPLVSDPGSSLISILISKGIKVIPIPGPSALTCALSICPFKLDEFLFIGFLPNQRSKRIKLLKSFENKSKLVVLFIAPHDLHKYAEEIYDLYPRLEIFLARELTKYYEEVWSGSIDDFINKIKNLKVKGETVLCLKFSSNSTQNSNGKLTLIVLNKLSHYLNKGFSLKQASKILSKELNIPSKKLYDFYIKSR